MIELMPLGAVWAACYCNRQSELRRKLGREPTEAEVRASLGLPPESAPPARLYGDKEPG